MKLAVVFWSGTGNTEAMADVLVDACKAEGADVTRFQVSEFNATEFNNYDAIAFGCPAMGDEELEPDEFQPMWDEVRPLLKGKKIGLFGSYNWNDGEWMRLWEEQAKGDGAILVCAPIPQYDGPDDECVEKLKSMAKALNQ